PLLYRQFFPVEFKRHRSHDILLLCGKCMENTNKMYDINKKNISIKYNVPLDVVSDSQIEITKLKAAMKIAKKIYLYFDEIPHEKKILMSKDLMTFLHDKENIEKYPYFFEEIFERKEVPKDFS